MARHRIENEILAIEADELGAELSSMKCRGTEYLWPGNPNTWNGRAPILFPIIGPLLGGSYSHAGKTYEMGQHGFARRSLWRFVEGRTDFMLFRLEAEAESLKQYPFPFVLEAGYGIRGNELECSYRIIHDGKQGKMPFAIGSHTAFRVPINPDLQFGDYELVFEVEEDTVRYLQTSEGPLSGETVPFCTQDKKLPLDHHFFAGGSIVFKELASQQISIRSDKDPRKVRISFADFPYCTLWTYLSSSEPYLCIEPWHGITATKGENRELSEREGNLFLQPGEDFTCSFQITLD